MKPSARNLFFRLEVSLSGSTFGWSLYIVMVMPLQIFAVQKIKKIRCSTLNPCIKTFFRIHIFNIMSKSVPLATCSALSSSNFSCHVILRLWLQLIRTFNPIIFCPLAFIVRISPWIWTAWSSILSWNRWIPNHPPLFGFCRHCHPTVVVTHYRTNNFSRPCSNTWSMMTKKVSHQNNSKNFKALFQYFIC